MNKKEVQLVLRGEDKGLTKSLTGAVAALKQLAGVQDDLTKSASSTGNTIDRLGSEFAALNAQLKGLTAIGQFSAELDKVTKSNNASIESLRAAKTASAALVSQYSEFAKKTQTLKVAVDSLDAALSAQRDAQKAAKANLASVNTEVSRAESAYRKFYESLKKVKEPSDALKQQYRDQRDALISLYGAQQKAEAAVAREKLRLEELTATHMASNAAYKAADTQRKNLLSTYEKSAAVIEKQAASAATEKAALIGLTEEAHRNARALGLTMSGQEQLAKDSATTTAALDKLTAALKRQEAAQASAQAAANTKLTGTTAADNTAQFRAQIAGAASAKQAMIAARVEATRLGKEMAATANPSRAMSASFEAARVNAKAATQEYYNQGVALNALKSSLRGTTDALSSLRGMSQSAFAGASANVGRVSKVALDANSSMRSLAAGTGDVKTAFSLFSEESRKAMSVAQRIRGQILSLASAYVGLYGAISGITKVTESIRTLDTVTTRLAVAFGGDTEKIATEIKFLQAQAIRLGFSFANLGGEYSKFAIAAKNSNFTAQETRDVFLSIAEAGRVLNLSTDESERVFRAFNQMMDKGVISSEELKGQIGDNGMAGAFQLFAKALGYTTAGLMDAMKAGQVFADKDTMLRVGKALREEYGSQLPKALSTLGANMDRTAAIFENFRMKIGQGGFGEALRQSLNDLNNAMAGGAGDKWAKLFADALTGLVKAISFVVKNLDLLIAAVKVFAALKLTSMASNMLDGARRLAAGFMATAIAAEKAAAQQKVFGVATAATAAKVSLSSRLLMSWRAVVLTLRGAWLALQAAMGGVYGIIISLGALALTTWLMNSKSATDRATEALDRHAEILEKVRQKYVESKGDIDKWAASLDKATVAELNQNLREAEKSLADLRDGIRLPQPTRGASWSMDWLSFGKMTGELEATTRAFREGKMSASEYKTKIDGIAETYKGMVDTDSISAAFANADKIQATTDAITKNRAALDAARGVVTETTKKTLELNDAVDQNGSSFDNVAPIERWKDKLGELKDMIPELADEMSRLKDVAKIDGLVDGIVGMGPYSPAQLDKYKELFQLAERARNAADLKSIGSQITGTSALDKSVALLKQFESFSARPYYDVNAYRAGYGSDTVTLSDGSIQKITQGMTVTQTDALRDLVRRIGEFQGVIKNQIGADRFGAFTPDQQAALTSIAYNYGSLPERIVDAVKSGSAEQIGAAVRGLRGDNGGINAGRRDQEAAILSQQSYGLNLNNAELAAKKAEAEAAATKSIKESIVAKQEELAISGLGSREQAIQKALDEERAKLKEVNRDLTKEEAAAITEVTGALWDVANSDKAINDLKDRQLKLQEKIKEAVANGDTTKVTELQNKLKVVNGELDAAISKAIAMWQAHQGEGSAAAIERLRELQTAIHDTGAATDAAAAKTNEWAAQINDSLVNNAMSAFDSFSQAIANGENAFKSLKTAFLQFASSFLQNIAKMIMEQALLNALTGGNKGSTGGVGGVIGGLMGGLFNTFHTGGVVGSHTAMKAVNPAVFAGALRYHTGGIAGLAPGEVPAILKKGEEVLTQNDPRHISNGGAAAAPNIKIVNAIDSGHFVSEGLNTTVGEKAILNFMRNNAGAVKSAIGG